MTTAYLRCSFEVPRKPSSAKGLPDLRAIRNGWPNNTVKEAPDKGPKLEKPASDGLKIGHQQATTFIYGRNKVEI